MWTASVGLSSFIGEFITPLSTVFSAAIVCGGILIVILSFRGLDPDGTVHKD